MGQPTRQKSPPSAKGNFLDAVIKRFVGSDFSMPDPTEIPGSNTNLSALYSAEVVHDARALDCTPYVLVALDNEFKAVGGEDAFPPGRIIYIKQRLEELTAEEMKEFREKFQRTPETEAARLGRADWHARVQEANGNITELQPKTRPS